MDTLCSVLRRHVFISFPHIHFWQLEPILITFYMMVQDLPWEMPDPPPSPFPNFGKFPGQFFCLLLDSLNSV